LAEEVAAAAPLDSPEYQRLWRVWEEIDAERHADFPETFCDDPLCDKCGHFAMGDDW